MIPAAAITTVLTRASQKNPQSSETPSLGPTSGPGVELPGDGVYGVWNDPSLIPRGTTGGRS